MTDRSPLTGRSRRGRGLVGLALVPLTAGLFGAGVTWAQAHDPRTAAASEPVAPAATTPAPVPMETTDPRLTALAAQVAGAQARVATLRAVLAQRAEDAAAAQAAADAAAAAAAERAAADRRARATSGAGSGSSGGGTARPAPRPPVDTVTRGSG